MNGRQFDQWTAAQLAVPPKDARSFTPTWDGFSSPPSGDVYYANLGALVVMWITKEMTLGTSDNTVFAITNVPEDIWPDTAQSVTIRAWDNGAIYDAYAFIDDDSAVMSFALKVVTGTRVASDSITSWTAAGNKGLNPGTVLIYSLL